MNWQDDLFEYFTTNKMYRVKHLNNLLHNYCKEYVLFLNEFNGMTAKFNPDYGKELPGILIGGMYISIRTDYLLIQEFKITCYFNQLGKLCLKYPDGYDYDKDWKSLLDKSTDKEKDFHSYEEDEINDPERIEKEYIFQLLNTRIKNFIESEKVNQSS